MNHQTEMLFKLIDAFNTLRGNPEFMTFIAGFEERTKSEDGTVTDSELLLSDWYMGKICVSSLFEVYSHGGLTEFKPFVKMFEDLGIHNWNDYADSAVLRDLGDEGYVINRMALSVLERAGISVDITFRCEDSDGDMDVPIVQFFCDDFAL